ncbi:MAG: TIGR03790 family protein [Phycisphaerae bacterium]
MSALVLLAVLAFPGVALALEPAEVIVVANANSEDSMELAKLYVKGRKIPEKNLIALKTTTAYQISYEDYASQIVAPLRKELTKRGLKEKATFLCLIYGVPVRVAAPAGGGAAQATAPAGATGNFHKIAMQRAHIRLQIDYKLAGTIGQRFPNVADRPLEPVTKLFDTEVTDPSKNLMKLDVLKKDLRRVLSQKQTALLMEGDKSKKAVMRRQLMGLYLNMSGKAGLLQFLQMRRESGSALAKELKEEVEKLEGRMDALRGKTGEDIARKRLELVGEMDGALGVIHEATSHGAKSTGGSATDTSGEKLKDADAAVDSELALLWFDKYKIERMLPNPHHYKNTRMLAKLPARTMKACRLDGPSKEDVRRMIEDSLKAEEEGLDGTFYIDAGGLPRAKQYDVHLTKLASFLQANSKFKTKLDTQKELFGKGSCPDTALYVGWYSLRRYIPAFIWNRGSVGWHIASFEARHLRDADSNEWCPKMIQNGVAATVGAVNEPYLGSFPLPEHFFPLLMTGESLGETYWRTTSTISWRMTLIGDPLYRPFKKNPAINKRVLPTGLAPKN